MNTGKNIFIMLLLMLTIPLALNAQVPRLKPKEEPRRRIVLSSGDTTVVVNKFHEGLNGKDAEFLYRDLRFLDDGLFPKENTKYQSLEEAAYDVNRLMKVMQSDLTRQDRDRKGKTGRSLSYRASQVERIKEGDDAKATETSKLATIDPSQQKTKRAEFGNQPTYFLNGMEVDFSVIEYLFPDEILSRTIKVTNLVSGNPNGEIWYSVPDKVLVDIGIVKFDAEGNPYVVGSKAKASEAKMNDVLDYIKAGRKKQ